MNFFLFGKRSTPSETCHQVNLSGTLVPFTLKRSSRRQTSLTVDHRGLRLLGPMSLSLRQAESLLVNHAAWIIQKLAVQQHRPAAWCITGTTPLPLLGVDTVVEVRPHSARHPRLIHEAGRICLLTKDPDDTPYNHKALVQWLRREALACFTTRINYFAGLLNVPIPTLSLSQAKTRWGSCSSQGHVRLNWRLIHLPIDLIDYVVVHELSHLREMNHSPRFWSVVESVYPEHKAARKALRSRIATLPLIELA